jgi:hypothetical protein
VNGRVFAENDRNETVRLFCVGDMLEYSALPAHHANVRFFETLIVRPLEFVLIKLVDPSQQNPYSI